MAKRPIRNIREVRPPNGFHWEFELGGVYYRELAPELRGKERCVTRTYWCRNGYHLERCKGEAHSNVFIDNCDECMPQWGVVAVSDVPEKPE